MSIRVVLIFDCRIPIRPHDRTAVLIQSTFIDGMSVRVVLIFKCSISVSRHNQTAVLIQILCQDRLFQVLIRHPDRTVSLGKVSRLIREIQISLVNHPPLRIIFLLNSGITPGFHRIPVCITENFPNYMLIRVKSLLNTGITLTG